MWRKTLFKLFIKSFQPRVSDKVGEMFRVKPNVSVFRSEIRFTCKMAAVVCSGGHAPPLFSIFISLLCACPTFTRSHSPNVRFSTQFSSIRLFLNHAFNKHLIFTSSSRSLSLPPATLRRVEALSLALPIFSNRHGKRGGKRDSQLSVCWLDVPTVWRHTHYIGLLGAAVHVYFTCVNGKMNRRDTRDECWNACMGRLAICFFEFSVKFWGSSTVNTSHYFKIRDW